MKQKSRFLGLAALILPDRQFAAAHNRRCAALYSCCRTCDQAEGGPLESADVNVASSATGPAYGKFIASAQLLSPHHSANNLSHVQLTVTAAQIRHAGAEFRRHWAGLTGRALTSIRRSNK